VKSLNYPQWAGMWPQVRSAKISQHIDFHPERLKKTQDSAMLTFKTKFPSDAQLSQHNNPMLVNELTQKQMLK
jgi:hypothetical protein